MTLHANNLPEYYIFTPPSSARSEVKQGKTALKRPVLHDLHGKKIHSGKSDGFSMFFGLKIDISIY